MRSEIKERIEKIKKGEVPEGYKKIKNSILPNSWNIEKLKETRCVDDKYSYTGGPFGSDLKSEDYVSEGIRILQLQNIGDGVFQDDYKIFTTKKKADELFGCNIYPGEIIIAKMAEPLARACIIPNDQERYLMASDGIRLKVDSNKYCSKYILEYINSMYFRNEAIKKGSGSTRLRIGLSVLGEIKLSIPSLLEQQKIANILSTWDKAIELKEKLIEQKKDQKKGLMKKFFTGKIRHLGFEGVWKYLKAGEIFCNVTNKSHKGIGIVLSSTQDKGIMPRDEMNIDIKYDEASLSNYKKVNIGEFVISLRSFQGGIEYSEYDGLMSPAYTILKNVVAIEPSFYRHLFKSVDFISRLNGLIYGIRDGKQIGYKDFSTMILPYPEIEEQKQIGEILDVATKEINLHQQELDALKLQKKGLMQLLLTGIVRVNN